MSESEIGSDFLRLWLRGSEDPARGSDLTIEPLAGDVSPRRYYRIRRGEQRAIVAYYPPDQRDVGRRYERTTELLTAVGVRVPGVFRIDRDAGLMLLEDVGDETLYDRRDRSWQQLRACFLAGWDAARRVRTVDMGDGEGFLPPLDGSALERELTMTWDLFLTPNGLAGDAVLGRRLRRCLEALCADLEDGGLVPCHRDLMARNLIPLGSSGAVCVLDHQDLRPGPLAYDAASLFNDSLYPPEEEVERILGSALYRSPAYDRAVVQRTWKIVGTFASFARRGQPRYLPLIPASLWRGLEHLGRLGGEEESVAADVARRWADAMGAPDGLLR